MPRIPDLEIERLKRQTYLVALVRSRGIELHRHGSKDFAGKCPFHQEDTGSFIVSPDKRAWGIDKLLFGRDDFVRAWIFDMAGRAVSG